MKPLGVVVLILMCMSALGADSVVEKSAKEVNEYFSHILRLKPGPGIGPFSSTKLGSLPQTLLRQSSLAPRVLTLQRCEMSSLAEHILRSRLRILRQFWP